MLGINTSENKKVWLKCKLLIIKNNFILSGYSGIKYIIQISKIFIN